MDKLIDPLAAKAGSDSALTEKPWASFLNFPARGGIHAGSDSD
jgi:hypothetical protein